MKVNIHTELDKKLSIMKKSYIQSIAYYGQDFIGKYRISFDELRQIFNRNRITDKLLISIKDYLEYLGFEVIINPTGIILTLTMKSMILSYEESLETLQAIEEYKLNNAT